MRQTKASIRKEIAALRRIIDKNRGEDIVLRDVAYVVECALRWAIEDTVGWDRPSKDVKKAAAVARSYLSNIVRP